MVVLEAERVLLREFRLDDHDGVHAFAGDAEVTRYTDWGPNTSADTDAFLAGVVADAAVWPRTRFGLAVVRRDDGVLIGAAELRVTSVAHQRGELGYALARRWWGRGYATEAAVALLRFGFEGLGLHRVSATCRPENVASARVLERVGMVAEGRLRGHLRVRGRWCDSLLFAALAPDVAGAGTRSG